MDKPKNCGECNFCKDLGRDFYCSLGGEIGLYVDNKKCPLELNDIQLVYYVRTKAIK